MHKLLNVLVGILVFLLIGNFPVQKQTAQELNSLESNTGTGDMSSGFFMVLSYGLGNITMDAGQKIVVTYDTFGLSDDSGEFTTGRLLAEWARAGLIDTVLLPSDDGNFDWHYQMYAPTRAVWIDLPENFNSAILDLPNNILKKDFILYDNDTEESIIPDSLYFEEWTFSKKSIKKFRIKKNNNNHFIYHNLSPGFLPAKHKSDLDKKAKKEKEKKERK